jgi:threonine dehydratase
MDTLDLDLIHDAEEFLRGRIRVTPVEPSPELSRVLGVPVTLKLEFLQLTGSFKLRGAFFRLSRLTFAERRAGVATCSAGNHGKAVAYASRELKLAATIYVPRDVDDAKLAGCRALGAQVVRSRSCGYDDTLDWAMEQAKTSDRTFISAFDDFDIMAGNGGTLASETMEQVPDARTFILPVGGGGLSAGFAFLAKEKIPGCRIIGCQLEASPALKLSLERGKAVTRLPAVETVAAGVEGGIGEKCFSVLKSRVDRVALVTEEEVYAAFRWVIEQHQVLIEPTAAVVVAACLSGKVGRLDSPAAVVLSGRNVGIGTVRKML